MTRRHTFFCVDRERHGGKEGLVEAVPKKIVVFGETIDGWIITTERPVIDKTITLAESVEGGSTRDPE